jgi:hypothetical protein
VSARLLACAAALALASPALTAAEAGRTTPASRAKALAKAAGCSLRTFPEEGRSHIDGPGTWKTNPPTSGEHSPIAAEDGIYAPGSPPPTEQWVHSLEHGRVLLQYRPGSSERRIDALTAIARERFHGRAGYHLLLFENTTAMPFAVAAVSWRRYVGCPGFNARTKDALRAFRTAYVDHAPEQIP